jgi:uncharacterized protein YjiK
MGGNMYDIRPSILSLAVLAFMCYPKSTQENDAVPGYELASPDTTFTLPHILHEISGLTHIDSNLFACIQDEDGIIFIYDAISNGIKRQIVFNGHGDYEGIARVGSTIYVLRNDGTLFEVADYKSRDFRLSSFRTGIPAKSNEGLCYDSDNNSLLIACKGKTGRGSELKEHRAIYAFDLKTKTLSSKPCFDFDVRRVEQFALDNAITLPRMEVKKGKGSKPHIRLEISAIGIHPLTKKLYCLSAKDYLLFVFDEKGILEHIGALNPAMFNKSEGIAFFGNGDMLISNEGEDKKPTLLRFNYRLQSL